ncbi:MAG: hypothetical protein KGD67_12270 [Candidatus Lokiarchaeota archaeon]|nr:hypothetical protein [Candidatus Lokiarchaeota archaeon]
MPKITRMTSESLTIIHIKTTLSINEAAIYADRKANQDPRNKCSEIQFLKQKFDNHFLEADKNFMRGDK